MEVLFDLLDESLVDVVGALRDALLLHVGGQVRAHAVDVLFLVEVPDLAGVQDAIDVL
jgi:hypothetical protein